MFLVKIPEVNFYKIYNCTLDCCTMNSMEVFFIVQKTIDIAISIIVVLLNGMFMIALVKKRELHNPSNAVLGCLCSCDLLMGITSLLVSILFLQLNFGASVDQQALFHRMLQTRSVFIALSAIFMTFVNVDRYAAICHPFKYLQYATPKSYAVMSTSACLLVVVILSSTIFFDRLYNAYCFMLVCTTVFVVITLILIYCNFKIIRVIRRHRRAVCPISCQPDNEKSVLQSETKRYRIVLLLFIIFVICKLPTIISLFFIHLSKVKLSSPFMYFLLTSNTLLLLDSLINPIVYYFRLRVFRIAIKEVFSCR